MDELYESELFWPEDFEGAAACYGEEVEGVSSRPSTWTTTTPVDIPSGGYAAAFGRRCEEEVSEEEEAEMLPPHVLVSRRRMAVGEAAAFMRCSGDGRSTLKGRDLHRLRNAVFRLTGFLEGRMNCGVKAHLRDLK